jgi:hypothetical protein
MQKASQSTGIAIPLKTLCLLVIWEMPAVYRDGSEDGCILMISAP